MPGSRPRGDERRDDKGLPVGRRGVRALVAGLPVRTPIGGGIEVDCFPIAPAPTLGRHSGGLGAADLACLYKHGLRYHRGRGNLEDSVGRGQWATEAMLDAHHSEPRREAAIELLRAAEDLERSSSELSELEGVGRVATASAQLAHAIELWVAARLGGYADESERLYEVGEAFNALAPVRLATRRLGPVPSMRNTHMQRVCVEGGAGTERDLVLLEEWEATDPLAWGALGIETIVSLSPPWSTVAWFAWCSAGRGTGWEDAWDLWTPLGRFSDKSIGEARGVSGDAVSKKRKRVE